MQSYTIEYQQDVTIQAVEIHTASNANMKYLHKDVARRLHRLSFGVVDNLQNQWKISKNKVALSQNH